MSLQCSLLHRTQEIKALVLVALVQLFSIAAAADENGGQTAGSKRIQQFARPLGAITIIFGLFLLSMGALTTLCAPSFVCILTRCTTRHVPLLPHPTPPHHGQLSRCSLLSVHHGIRTGRHGRRRIRGPRCHSSRDIVAPRLRQIVLPHKKTMGLNARLTCNVLIALSGCGIAVRWRGREDWRWGHLHRWLGDRGAYSTNPR